MEHIIDQPLITNSFPFGQSVFSWNVFSWYWEVLRCPGPYGFAAARLPRFRQKDHIGETAWNDFCSFDVRVTIIARMILTFTAIGYKPLKMLHFGPLMMCLTDSRYFSSMWHFCNQSLSLKPVLYLVRRIYLSVWIHMWMQDDLTKLSFKKTRWPSATVSVLSTFPFAQRSWIELTLCVMRVWSMSSPE